MRRYRGAVLNDTMTGKLIIYENLTDVFTIDGQGREEGGKASSGRVKAVLSPRSKALDKTVIETLSPAHPVDTTESRLEARHLQKSYGSRKVVHDVSISVKKAKWWDCWAPTAQARRPRST